MVYFNNVAIMLSRFIMARMGWKGFFEEERKTEVLLCSHRDLCTMFYLSYNAQGELSQDFFTLHTPTGTLFTGQVRHLITGFRCYYRDGKFVFIENSAEREAKLGSKLGRLLHE